MLEPVPRERAARGIYKYMCTQKRTQITAHPTNCQETSTFQMSLCYLIISLFQLSFHSKYQVSSSIYPFLPVSLLQLAFLPQENPQARTGEG